MPKGQSEAKIKFTAETKQFNAEIKSASASLRSMRSAMRLNSAQFKATGNAAQMLKNKQTLLRKEQAANKAEIQALASKLKSAENIFGKNSTEANNLRNKLTSARVTEANLKTAVNDTNTALNKQQAEERQTASAFGQLNSKIGQQKTELDKAKMAYQNAYIQYGKNSKEAKQYGAQIRQMSAGLKTNQTAMGKATSAANKFDSTAAKIKSPVASLKTGLKGLAVGAVAAFSVQGVVNFGKACVSAFKDAEVQNKKLDVIMTSRLHATKADVKSVQDLIAAQSRQGVVGKTVQAQGAQQLGTFVHQSKSLKTLIPAMNNLAVQQNGVNTTGKDMQNIGNMMGKVFTGQVGALKRVGISFTAGQEKVLKYGNEEQKAAMLSQVITDNVGNMNKKMAETDAGKIKNAQNQIAELKVQIGGALLPVLAKALGVLGKVIGGISTLFNKIKNPTKQTHTQLKSFGDFVKGQFAGVFKMLKPVIDTLSPVFLKLGEAFKSGAKSGTLLKVALIPLRIVITILATTIKAVILIIRAIIAVIKAVIVVIKAIITAIKAVVNAVRTSVNWIKSAVRSVATFVPKQAKNAVRGVISYLKKINAPVNAVLGSIRRGFARVASWISAPFKKGYNFVKRIMDKIKTAVSGIKFPHIKLPHFKITGSFSLKKKTTPHLTIDWYANGAVFKKPTLLNGMNGFSGVGEAGAEAVAPISVLQNYVGNAVAGALNGLSIDYGKIGDAVADAVKSQGIVIKMDNRELGRAVRGAI